MNEISEEKKEEINNKNNKNIKYEKMIQKLENEKQIIQKQLNEITQIQFLFRIFKIL